MEYLEPLDQEEKEEDLNFSKNKKETFSELFYLLMFVGFIVLLGIKFYQSWPSQNDIQRNAINNKRVDLLKTTQTSQDNIELESAISDYDSLTQVLETLEED